MTVGRHKFLARVPVPVWELLEQKARAEGVSLNEMLVSLLRDGLEGRGVAAPRPSSPFKPDFKGKP